jgi:predicted ATP-grasp superfamily ATP-dependent carboligase
MYTLIIYGNQPGWINFSSDVLLPYFYDFIKKIKLFDTIPALVDYLNGEGSNNVNYILPLLEESMLELHENNIYAMMPKWDIVCLFQNKQLFNNYVNNNNLVRYIPITYTEPSNSKELVIVKPPCGGNSCGVYLNMLNKVETNIWYTHVIQEYVHGDKEYAGYFAVNKGKIIHSFAYSRYYGNRIYIKGDSQDNTTQTKIEIDRKYLDIFEHFFTPVKFTGTCCVDFKIDDGNLKIFEINPRIGGSLSYPENIKDAATIITELIRIFYN